MDILITMLGISAGVFLAYSLLGVWRRWKKRREEEEREAYRRERERRANELPTDPEARRRVLAVREQGTWGFWEMAKNDATRQLPYLQKAQAAKQEFGEKARPCPKCGAAADNLAWFYFSKQWFASSGRERGSQGWMTACESCKVRVNFFPDPGDGSIEYWENARSDAPFQSLYAPKLPSARQRYGNKANPCPVCGTAPDKMDWFYFASPGDSWRARAGRAGWMIACPQCNILVNYFLELMS